MGGKISIAALLFSVGSFACFGQVVEIPRDERTKSARISSEQHQEEEGLTGPTAPIQPNASNAIKQTAPGSPMKPAAAQVQPRSTRPTIEEMWRAGALAGQRVRKGKFDIQSRATAAPTSQASKIETVVVRPLDDQAREPEPVFAHVTGPRGEMAFIKLADGFDFPVGKPDANGYYKARGFRSKGHLGEDWDGVGGGDTDLGDPIYSIGDGVVVFARDCHLGWGNVVVVRHAYREGGFTRNIDSLYAHLQKILVHRGQAVKRGQEIATLGTAHGLYDAHLHFEIRKNIEIGMSRAKFAQNLSNYFDPSGFIVSHRHLQDGGRSYRIALNTFTHDARIRWDKLPDYSHSHTGGGSSESAAALKKTLAAQNAVAR